MHKTAPFSRLPSWLAGAALAALADAACAQAAAVAMDVGPLLRCRIIAEPAARLACYDAVPLPGLGSRSGWGAPVAPPAAATAPAAAARAASPDGAARFGLERQAAQAAPDRLESRLRGSFEGWEPNTRFTLDNGQVWQIVDGSRAYYPKIDQPRAVVSRGLLGSFYLQIDGVNQTPRVRRVE